MGPSSPFDGLLLLKNGREQKIELTAAVDGRNDALQMEFLRERGHAPGFQSIEVDREGTKRQRKFGPNRTRMINVDEYNETTILPLLARAFDAKVKKSRTSASYSNAWLGIVFDDHISPEIERKRDRFDPLFVRLIANHDSSFPFERIFGLGVSRTYVFDSWKV